MHVGSPRAIADRWLTTYLFAGLGLLVVGGVVGYGVATQLSTAFVLEQIASAGGIPDEITFWTLVVNNVIAVTVMLLGAVSVGTVTVFSLLLNGFLVGLVVQFALRETSLLEVFLLIAPHGVVEIPAMLIVAAIGLRFGHRTVRYLLDREEELFTGRELREAGLLYVLAIAMIVVAAYIEAEFTIQIAESIAGTSPEPVTG